MPDTTVETIERLLESALEETDDTEIRFKLRTALQLLIGLEAYQDDARQTLQEADLDDDVRERLEDLGYIGGST